MQSQQQQQQRECLSCEKPGNGRCAVCHGTGEVRKEISKWKFRGALGMKTETVNCSSCNNPAFGSKKSDGLCFFCKGKGYVLV